MEKHPGTSNNCDTWESDVPPPPTPPGKKIIIKQNKINLKKKNLYFFKFFLIFIMPILRKKIKALAKIRINIVIN